MYALLLKFGSWLGQKLIVAGLIVLVALAGYGVWLFVQDEAGAEIRRLERLQRTIAERSQLQAARATIERRIAALRTDIDAQQERAKQVAKVIEVLRGLESWWER